MQIPELLQALQAAHADTVAKAEARDKASAALDAADKAWRASAEKLSALRDEASALIGALLPTADSRFRKSA